jgi:hypothetical protein
MDLLREGLLRGADTASLALQNGFQSFGFLPDGVRVRLVSGGSGGTLLLVLQKRDADAIGDALRARSRRSRWPGGYLMRSTEFPDREIERE